MRTREEILADWATRPTLPEREKVDHFWLEMALDMRDLSGGVSPAPEILEELEAIHAAIDANVPDIETELDGIDVGIDLVLEESKKLVLGQEQTAQMVKDCLTKIIELLEKIASK